MIFQVSFRTLRIVLGNITTISHLRCDVWLEIFQYFEAIELFSTLKNVTGTSDEVLFNEKFRNQLRGLVIDCHITNLLKGLTLNQVISLTMNNGASFGIVKQCCSLHSLKLKGESEWIISLVTKCSQISIKFEQLSITIPDIKPLHQILACISSLNSLRRLEIHAEELEETIGIPTVSMAPSKIEQLILKSCSAITYRDLSHMQSGFICVRYLSISLFQRSRISVHSFTFPFLRSLRVSLLEVPFEEINRLVSTMPSLMKLKLYGFADDVNFVNSDKWIHLLTSISTLFRITVDISLQHDSSIFYCEKTRAALHKINMSLTSIFDDLECYSHDERQLCWWQLKGVIRK
ncbi:unnamed protein product [Adineta ricciae]|uniref:Uncharacterized protein n=1 Tax=Adineta ricciae TaxID=249248 RepID=A0A815WN11_ADIRI|nr:unnamed protein product [Adineta ricciae]CAF1608303.1 unnamed protein product [Adineta ricciae]